MIHHMLGILAVLLATKCGLAVTIISARQIGSTPFIVIKFRHSGRSLENKFEFRLDSTRDQESDCYSGRVVHTETQVKDLNAETENFLVYDLAEKITGPSCLQIFGDDEGLACTLIIKNFSFVCTKDNVQTPKNKSKRTCTIF